MSPPARSGDGDDLAPLERLLQQLREGLGDGLADAAADDPREHRARALCAAAERLLDELPGAATGDPSSPLRERIAVLPPASRLPCALHLCVGYSAATIARLLGRAEPEVRELIERAGARLERRLASDILLVGREALTLHALVATLTDAGHTVVGVAASRARALSLAERSPPQLLVVDAGVEDDGGEAVAAARVIAERLRLPVVLLHAGARSARGMVDGRAVELVAKPFEASTLRRHCLRALLLHER